MGIKATERDCLDASLQLCPSQQGETRRILKRLASAIRLTESERPDFVFSLPPVNRNDVGMLVGLEHFAVDQLCEAQQKREGVYSMRAKRDTEFKALQQKFAPKIEAKGILPDEAIHEFMQMTAEVMADNQSASYPELIKSFKSAFIKHLGKVDDYRKHLRMEFGGYSGIEIAFLIELHSDMSRYMRTDGVSIEKCELGDTIIFDDMLRIIEQARGKVDFIIIASYGNAEPRPAKVLAFKCGNPEKSIRKQGIPICTFVGMDAERPAFVKPRPEITFEYTKNDEAETIDGVFTVNGLDLTEDVKKELIGRSFMRARSALQDGRHCVTSAALADFITAIGNRTLSLKK